MRPLRIAVYVIAAAAILVIAYGTSLRPVHHSGAEGSPATWNRFLRAYLYASLDHQAKPGAGESHACDYPPPKVDGKRPEDADHETMLGYARCLERLGELTAADLRVLEQDTAFAVKNGDWLPFERAGVAGASRGGKAITVSLSATHFHRTRFLVTAAAGLAILAAILALDLRCRRPI